MTRKRRPKGVEGVGSLSLRVEAIDPDTTPIALPDRARDGAKKIINATWGTSRRKITHLWPESASFACIGSIRASAREAVKIHVEGIGSNWIHLIY